MQGGWDVVEEGEIAGDEGFLEEVGEAEEGYVKVYEMMKEVLRQVEVLLE